MRNHFFRNKNILPEDYVSLIFFVCAKDIRGSRPTLPFWQKMTIYEIGQFLQNQSLQTYFSARKQGFFPEGEDYRKRLILAKRRGLVSRKSKGYNHTLWPEMCCRNGPSLVLSTRVYFREKQML